MMEPRQSIKILLVEDDDGHAKLIERNLRKVNLSNPIDRVRDGMEAIEYLHNEGRFTDRAQYSLPRLVLLDINMPRMDGIEVLERIKADERLHSLPVIMLTSTDNQAEIDRCYHAGASGYVAKPVNIVSLGEKLERLGMFLEIVELPEVA
ncbi:MAG: response regulator [Candidatus Binatia bacterium]